MAYVYIKYFWCMENFKQIVHLAFVVQTLPAEGQTFSNSLLKDFSVCPSSCMSSVSGTRGPASPPASLP